LVVALPPGASKMPPGVVASLAGVPGAKRTKMRQPSLGDAVQCSFPEDGGGLGWEEGAVSWVEPGGAHFRVTYDREEYPTLVITNMMGDKSWRFVKATLSLPSSHCQRAILNISMAPSLSGGGRAGPRPRGPRRSVRGHVGPLGRRLGSEALNAGSSLRARVQSRGPRPTGRCRGRQSGRARMCIRSAASPRQHKRGIG
jgi:hypothetical protein